MPSGPLHVLSTKALFLNPTGKMLSQFDHEFFSKLFETRWIRVQLISPIRDLKHLLGRNQDKVVRWIARERRQKVLKIDKRLSNNRSTLPQIIARRNRAMVLAKALHKSDATRWVSENRSNGRISEHRWQSDHGKKTNLGTMP